MELFPSYCLMKTFSTLSVFRFLSLYCRRSSVELTLPVLHGISVFVITAVCKKYWLPIILVPRELINKRLYDCEFIYCLLCFEVNRFIRQEHERSLDQLCLDQTRILCHRWRICRLECLFANPAGCCVQSLQICREFSYPSRCSFLTYKD